MEYQVPQFIEVEDKIFGPFTFSQFVYLAGGAGLIVALNLYLPRIFAIIASLPVAALALALAFYKINNKSFTDMLEAGAKYYLNERLYLWKKTDKKDVPVKRIQNSEPVRREKLDLSGNRLHELAWSLDIKDRVGTSEDPQ
jgi:hypothetical protein